MIKTLLIFAIMMLWQPPQVERTAKAELSESEWILVLNIIDNAPVPGELRKPLIKKIQDQLRPQLKDSVGK